MHATRETMMIVVMLCVLIADAPGVFLYSFPQNCSAQLCVEVAGGKPGDKVVFRCGEHKNARERLFGGYVVGCDLVADGQPLMHQWVFFYLGMQFVEVSGAVPAGHANPQPLNHCMLGHVLEWYYGYVAGIRQPPGGTGWKQVLMAPNPGPLASAEATLRTPAGRIVSRWRKENATFRLEAEIPQGCSATAILPSGRNRPLDRGRQVLEKPLPPGK